MCIFAVEKRTNAITGLRAVYTLLKYIVMATVLDKTDYAILEVLRDNSRLSVREIAARVHRSPTPIFDRLRRMESEGVIEKYTVRLNDDKLGLGFTVFCNVKLRHINSESHADFAAAVGKMPEVTECYNVSGSFDYLLKVCVPDMPAYRRFVTDRLGLLPDVDSVQSVFVMATLKRD